MQELQWNEHTYTIEFGDPWGDGHGYSETVVVTANYSYKDVITAYYTIAGQWGYGFLEQTNVATSFLEGDYILGEFVDLLWKNEIITDSGYLEHRETGVFDYTDRNCLTIMFQMAKLVLPDLTWKFANPIRIDLCYGRMMER